MTNRTAHRRRPRPALGVVLSTAAALLVATSIAPSYGRLSATIGNTGDTLTTATMLYTHAYAGPRSCTSVPASGPITDAVQSVACPGGLWPATSAASAVDTITPNGTVPAARVTQQVTVASCGAVQLADSVGADPMLARGAMTFRNSGPLTGSAAIGGDGSSALGADTTASNLASLLGSNYSVGVWFQVASGYASGGALLGFGTSPAAGSESSYDHVLWMTTAGRIEYGVTGTLGAVTATTPSAYNDGAWHLAVVTQSSLLLGAVSLYIDGNLTATSVGLAALSGYSGYWHVGWSQLAPAWDGTASAYLVGSLSDAFVTNTTLSGAAVNALAAAGTQASWNAQVAGFAHSWPLADTGRSTFSGSAPTIGATNPCSYVDAAFSATGPAASIATTPLSTLADNAPRTLAVAAAGGTQTLTVTLTHDASYAAVSAYVAGLILYAPVSMTYTVSSSWRTTFSWTAVRTATTSTSAVTL